MHGEAWSSRLLARASSPPSPSLNGGSDGYWLPFSTHRLRLRALLRNRLFSCGGGGQSRDNLNVLRICRCCFVLFCRVAGNISSNGRAGLRSEYNNRGRGGQRSILAARTTAARQPGAGRLTDVSSFRFRPCVCRDTAYFVSASTRAYACARNSVARRDVSKSAVALAMAGSAVRHRPLRSP